MSLMERALARASNQPVETYAPVLQMTLSVRPKDMSKLKNKFVFLPNREYRTFHSLAQRQGVNLGSSYKGCDYAKQ